MPHGVHIKALRHRHLIVDAPQACASHLHLALRVRVIGSSSIRGMRLLRKKLLIVHTLPGGTCDPLKNPTQDESAVELVLRILPDAAPVAEDADEHMGGHPVFLLAIEATPCRPFRLVRCGHRVFEVPVKQPSMTLHHQGPLPHLVPHCITGFSVVAGNLLHSVPKGPLQSGSRAIAPGLDCFCESCRGA